MLVVDAWHWLNKDGDFITHDLRLYRRMLRIARFIEYGGRLAGMRRAKRSSSASAASKPSRA